MKKIISLLSALAIFSSVAVTGYAAKLTGGVNELKTATSSEPKVQIWADGYDEDDYIVLKCKLINNESLSYGASKGKVTSNAINMIQIKVTLDSDVFDTTETYITPSTTGINVSGDNTDTLTYAFAPTTVDTYMSALPEYLFEIAVLPNAGTTVDNIPADAITFGETIVEYTAYKGVKTADCTAEAATADMMNYTIYAYEAPTKDYDLACKFTGTSTEWPEEGGEGEGEGEETAEAMAAGVAVTEGVYAGMTSASTDVVAADELVKIVISNDVDTSNTLEWEAPATLGVGKTNVLAVLLYDAAAMKDSTFTVKFLGAADAVIKAFTHKVQ